MEKYRFSVDGVPVIIYSISSPRGTSELIRKELSGEELACILYPDSTLDFRVECFDKNNEKPREPSIIFAALSCFFTNLRAYPHMSVDIAYDGRTEEIELSSNAYTFSVNDEKCKIICTNKAKFNDGIEIEYYIVNIGGYGVAVTLCADSDLFDTDAVRRLLSVARPFGARSALSASLSESIRMKMVGDALPSESVCALTVILREKKIRIPIGRQIAFISGRECAFLREGGRLFFYPETKYLY